MRPPNAEEIPTTASPYSITVEDLIKMRDSMGRLSTQLFAGFVVCLGTISFGTTLGWSHALSLKDFQNEAWLYNFKWFISMVPLGASFGTISSLFLANHLGPRKSLLVQLPLYILACALLFVRDRDLTLSMRFFMGVLGISLPFIGGQLLHQTVHVRMQRYLCIAHNPALLVGVFASGLMMQTSYFWLTVFTVSVPSLQFVLVLFMKESPMFLYTKSSILALASMTWYRGAGSADAAMVSLRKDWEVQRVDSEHYSYMLWTKAVRSALLVILALTAFQVLSSYFVFMLFGTAIWASEGCFVFTHLIDELIVAGVFICSKIFWTTFHSYLCHFKVRPFLLSSCVICAVIATLLASDLVLDHLDIDVYVNVRYTPLILACLFLFFFDMGLNHYPDILIYDYMPFQVYKLALMIVRSFYWVMLFFNLFFFIGIRSLDRHFICFVMFAVITYAATLVAYLFVVEPRGKSLIEIQMEFGGNPVGRRSAFYKSEM